MTKKVCLEDEAKLFRSPADNPGKVVRAHDELIGEGLIEKMARLALSDPDGEIWRYSIWSPSRWYRDKEIKQLMAILMLLKDL